MVEMKKIQKAATRMTWDEKSGFVGINVQLSIYLTYQKYSWKVIRSPSVSTYKGRSQKN